MLKDTKSLGNNKAPACESRGFVLKKEGVLFDTPSLSFAGFQMSLKPCGAYGTRTRDHMRDRHVF